MHCRESQGSNDLDPAAFGSENILLSMTEDEGVQTKNSGEKFNLTSVMATEKWVKCVTKADRAPGYKLPCGRTQQVAAAARRDNSPSSDLQLPYRKPGGNHHFFRLDSM